MIDDPVKIFQAQYAYKLRIVLLISVSENNVNQ